jgi:hypothetical protein
MDWALKRRSPKLRGVDEWDEWAASPPIETGYQSSPWG